MYPANQVGISKALKIVNRVAQPLDKKGKKKKFICLSLHIISSIIR